MTKKKSKRSKQDKKGKAKGFLSNVILWKHDSPTDSHLRKYFIATILIITLLNLLLALNVGLNADESFHYQYEKILFDYFETDKPDPASLISDKSSSYMHLSPRMFDIISGYLNKWFGNISNYDEGYYKVRHILNSIYLSSIILILGLCLAKILNWRSAILASILLFLVPRFTGHGLMNPRDIPFALGYALYMFGLLKFLPLLPKIDYKSLGVLILGVGLTAASRSTGLFLLSAFTGFLLFIDFLFKIYQKKVVISKFWIYIGALIGSVLGGILIALVFWPYGQLDPVAHFLEGFKVSSDFVVNIRLLFKGDLIFGGDLNVFQYIMTWYWISLPPALITGLIFFLFSPVWYVKNYGIMPLVIVLTLILLPLGYLIYRNSNIYDGIRHLTFLYAPIVVLVTIGWEYMRKVLSIWSFGKYIMYALIVLLSIDPALHLVKNPNLSYVYFNFVSGGPKAAMGNYEMDYWGLSVKDAVEWMLENELFRGFDKDKKATVVSNFGYPTRIYLGNNDNVRTGYARFRERYDKEWDYGIFVGRFIDGTQLRSGYWPSSRAIHTIKVDGVPVAAVYQNIDRVPFRAQKAFKSKKYSDAIRLFEQEVKAHPDNDIAWKGLGISYLNMNSVVKSEEAFNEVLRLNPGDSEVLNYLGIIKYNSNQISAARDLFLSSIDYNKANYFAYFYLAQIAFRNSDLIASQKYIEEALRYNPNFKEAYLLLADVYDALGDKQNASQIRRRFGN